MARLMTGETGRMSAAAHSIHTREEKHTGGLRRTGPGGNASQGPVILPLRQQGYVEGSPDRRPGALQGSRGWQGTCMMASVDALIRASQCFR
jgi:hypothetical protein